MARKDNQKLKITYLMKIFSEKTDELHGITMQEIISELEQYGIHAERKGIYSDISYLKDYGFDIESRPAGRSHEYYLTGRTFELAELKLLVDSVQSSKFITEKKSHELIKKLETLCSLYEAKQLDRQVIVQGRVKTMNERIFYNVDALHSAINSNRKIVFHYWQWNVGKEPELRRNGALYKVSPWRLLWDNENYYLVAFDDTERKLKHYRVDKMLHIEMTGEAREGEEFCKDPDMSDYSRRIFGMFGGEVRRVSLECENSFAGVIIDRFGRDVFMYRTDDGHFSVSVSVAVSGQFFGWLTGLGGGVRLTGPADVVRQLRGEAERILRETAADDIAGAPGTQDYL